MPLDIPEADKEAVRELLRIGKARVAERRVHGTLSALRPEGWAFCMMGSVACHDDGAIDYTDKRDRRDMAIIALQEVTMAEHGRDLCGYNNSIPLDQSVADIYDKAIARV